MVLALLIAAALIVFVVQNDREVPVTWWFVEVNGPLWAVIIVAAVAGAVLTEVPRLGGRPSSPPPSSPLIMSTRRLIFAALLCGLAILLAFTLQVLSGRYGWF